MARKQVSVVPNQVFVGLPWRNVRPRYENCIDRLERKYPLHFTIVGRNDAQDAADLLEVIKARIESSSFGIFDATGGNANVSLEYGYAEAMDLPRAICLSTHKAASGSSSTIISDLGGKRRVEYKNEQSLGARLEAFCKEHDYTKRFETFMSRRVRPTKQGQKVRLRALAIKMVHFLDDRSAVRRTDLVQGMLALRYDVSQVEEMLKKLHSDALINISRGRTARVRVA